MATRIDVKKELSHDVVVIEGGVTKASSVIELSSDGPVIRSSTGTIEFVTSSGNVISSIAADVDSVNFVKIGSSNVGEPVKISPDGQDETIDLIMSAKGSQGVIDIESPLVFSAVIKSNNLSPIVLPVDYRDVVIQNLNADLLQGLTVSQIMTGFIGVLPMDQGGTNNSTYSDSKFLVSNGLSIVSSVFGSDSFLGSVDIPDGNVPITEGGQLVDSGYGIVGNSAPNSVITSDPSGVVTLSNVVLENIQPLSGQINIAGDLEVTNLVVTGEFESPHVPSVALLNFPSELTTIDSPEEGYVAVVTGGSSSEYGSYIWSGSNWLSLNRGRLAVSLQGKLFLNGGSVYFEDDSNVRYQFSNLKRRIVGEIMNVDPLTEGKNSTTLYDFDNLAVYRNGLRLLGSGNDYSIIGNSRISLAIPLEIDDLLLADYETLELP